MLGARVQPCAVPGAPKLVDPAGDRIMLSGVDVDLDDLAARRRASHEVDVAIVDAQRACERVLGRRRRAPFLGGAAHTHHQSAAVRASDRFRLRSRLDVDL